MLKVQLAGKPYTISSAGVAALVGKPMDPFAREVLAQHGIPADDHCAVQLERQHAQEADLILVMEKELVDAVLRIAPDARGKTFTLGKWLGDRAIHDPYKQSRAAFEHSFVLIQEAIVTWLKHLK
jgi:protein-tyrosine phosphatase